MPEVKILREAASAAPEDAAKNETSSSAADLEDWGFRAGAGEGECKLRGKWLSKANGVKSGLWECTPGKFEVPDRPNVESFQILTGTVKLTDLNTGKETVLLPGDMCTLELGTSVRWEVLTTVTKFFVIAPPEAEKPEEATG